MTAGAAAPMLGSAGDAAAGSPSGATLYLEEKDMHQHKRRVRTFIAFGLAGTLALTACGGGGQTTSGASEQSEVAPTEGSDAAAALEVTATEYAFEGLPETVPVGTEFTFTNGGKEAHELVLLNIPDDEKRPVEELLALPPEEAQKLGPPQGVAVAAPGQDGMVVDGTLVAEKPGRYVAVCFVPVGTTELPEGPPQEGEEQGGPPHFTQGMVREFTVE